MRHKHADLIIAWAEGAEIECLNENTHDWGLVPHPRWMGGYSYRIKPREPRRFWVNVYGGHKDGYASVYTLEQAAISVYNPDGETIEVVEVLEDE